MRLLIVALLPLFPAFAADPVQLGLTARAQSDFEQVRTSPAPTLAGAAQCVQSQAALLPVTATEDVPLVRFRQGYCALTAALLSRNQPAFEDAARAFDAAGAAWKYRPRDKKAPPEPEPSAAVALAAMARISAGAQGRELESAAARLAEARRANACPASLIPVGQCLAILEMAAAWQGWIAVHQDRLDAAARFFAAGPVPGWSDWVAGRQAFGRRQYAVAADDYRRAVESWAAAEKSRTARIPQGQAPPPDEASVLADLAGARIAAGDPRAALSALDAALRLHPKQPWPLFLRARARELTGDPQGALADYNLASRAALAGAGDLSAGEGRFYRGVWTFRRGDPEAAEAEFTEALNSGVPASLAADAVAWRALSAVTAGSCGASREKLESAAALASPFFPKAEAHTAIAACGALPVRVSEVR